MLIACHGIVEILEMQGCMYGRKLPVHTTNMDINTCVNRLNVELKLIIKLQVYFHMKNVRNKGIPSVHCFLIFLLITLITRLNSSTSSL